jgi:hypothetical protein
MSDAPQSDDDLLRAAENALSQLCNPDTIHKIRLLVEMARGTAQIIDAAEADIIKGLPPTRIIALASDKQFLEFLDALMFLRLESMRFAASIAGTERDFWKLLALTPEQPKVE